MCWSTNRTGESPPCTIQPEAGSRDRTWSPLRLWDERFTQQKWGLHQGKLLVIYLGLTVDDVYCCNMAIPIPQQLHVWRTGHGGVIPGSAYERRWQQAAVEEVQPRWVDKGGVVDNGGCTYMISLRIYHSSLHTSSCCVQFNYICIMQYKHIYIYIIMYYI